MKQVFQRPECGLGRRGGLIGCGQVGPIGRKESLTAVGQDQDEKEPTFPMHRPENVQRLPFEGMAGADNRDLLGEVLMMGSMSYVRSTVCRKSGW